MYARRICRKCSQLEKSKAIARSLQNILAVKWRDKKYVHMLSTKHTDIDCQLAAVKRKRGSEEEVLKPKCIVEYNKGMNDVDRQDQVLASHPIMRRSMKAYKKIVFILWAWQCSIPLLFGKPSKVSHVFSVNTDSILLSRYSYH